MTRSSILRDLDRKPAPRGAGPRRRKCPGRWRQVHPSHGSSGQRQRRRPQRRRGLPRRGRAARDSGGVARAKRGAMGRVGAGSTAWVAAAGSLLLLLLLLARPPPAAARNIKESGEPAGLPRHRRRGPGAGGGRGAGRIVTHGGAPVRSPGAALKRGSHPGLRPLRGIRARKTPHAAFLFRARRVRSIGAYPTGPSLLCFRGATVAVELRGRGIHLRGIAEPW